MNKIINIKNTSRFAYIQHEKRLKYFGYIPITKMKH